MQLLDTDVLIDLLRGLPQARAWLGALPHAPAVPGLVVLELLQGCRNLQETRRIEQLATMFQIFWPTPADCDRALTSFPHLHLTAGIGLLDVLIGECAAGLDAYLCTFNARHFQAISNLRISQPYARP